MANISVSRVCNLHCPYCFAGGYLAAARPARERPFITPEAFAERLDFTVRSGMPEVRLIGGEPTLHPEFPALVRLARERGLRVVVFSHGLMPEAALTCLESLPPDQCSVLINMNAATGPSGPSEREAARRLATLARLGPRALPGLTIYQPGFELEPVLDAVERTGCQPRVRIGLAHPIDGAQNRFLHPKQYPFVGRRLALLAGQAAGRGARLEFDCGFVRCMFSPEDLERLNRAGTQPVFLCSPILDVDIAGSVVHCFPLAATLAASLGPADTAQGLRDGLARRAAPFRAAGVYRECSSCGYKEQDICRGGCLAAALRRFHQGPFRIAMPARAAAGGD